MKIAVASDDGKSIARHLGRCRSFVVFEVELGKIARTEIRDNSFTAHGEGHTCGHNDHEPGQSGHSHAGVIGALGDCQVVISQGMGWRIAKDLEEARIQPVITGEEDAEQAVRKYLTEDLEHFSGNFCGCGK
jgi:predicted Fe-Mo cluster-binding NifX family protein